MATRAFLLGGLSVAALLAASTTAWAQAEPVEPAAVETADAGEEIVVKADRAGLLETRPSDTVFGLNKPLIETPRSASLVSDLTLERYGVQTINDLVAVSPSTYTASFFGVPGAVNVRGTLAETYFRGFKRIENRGTYSTPLGAASQVEIVRGPPTPIYGPGKVGGLLNFIPKSARRGAAFESSAKVTATVGSYDLGAVTAEGGIPLTLGTIDGGIYLYAEAEASSRYYRGVSPEHQTFQISADFDLAPSWTTAFGAMIYRSDGDVQSPGWNRLTQDLIDNQTYITGRDTDLQDFDGNGRITPNEAGAIQAGGPGAYPFGVALYTAFFGFPPGTDALHQLDTGIGTTKLDRRTIYVSGADFSETETNTYYFDIARSFSDDSSIKLQFFYDDLKNDRFVSYGYPASFDSSVWEARGTYDFAFESGIFKAQSFVGASYRKFDGRRRESFNSGLIALDRRDLAFGPTGSDIIDSPFDNDPVVNFIPGVYSGLGWENDNASEWSDTGIFLTSDIFIGENLNIVLGARYDWYDVTSEDTGGNGSGISFQPFGEFSDDKGDFTYSASISYKLPYGFMPYFTYAESSALEMSQAGDIAPSLVSGDRWLSDSELLEGGLKFSLMDGQLIGSIAYYEQERTQLISGPTPTVQGTNSKGAELEIRYVVNDNFSFTFAGNTQETTVKGPDTSFQYIPYYVVGNSPTDSFGGAYVVFSFAGVPGRAGDYKYTLIPDEVVSLYATYTSDDYDWGLFGGTLGFTHATKTSGTVPNAPVYPSYTVLNGSVFVATGPITVTLNVDNITDELYFTPGADVYANLSAMPSRGREFRLTLAAAF